ncbi:MAG: MXAN_5187 C-terminal domain-containing protein [Pyrinomonadaceae bacterium]
MARENAFGRRLRESERVRHAAEARQGQKKTVLLHELPPSIDDQLIHLEEDLRRLKIEYDIFFNGAAKRPPFDTKSRVEMFIKRVGDERKLTFAQRYRYNSLVARYVALRDLWRRNVQEREEGRDPLAAARAALGKPREQAERKRHASFVCADARSDKAAVKNLYDALLEAKKNCGEPVEDLSFAKFHRMIASKTDALKERLGCERVRYSIYTEAGHVSFKAKADS